MLFLLWLDLALLIRTVGSTWALRYLAWRHPTRSSSTSSFHLALLLIIIGFVVLWYIKYIVMIMNLYINCTRNLCLYIYLLF